MLKPFFEGWYYKQQAGGTTLAVIPGRSSGGAFIQVITDKESFNIPFALPEYRKDRILQMAGNEFSNSGIKLNVKRNGISLYGELRYSNLTPLKGDVMGPFRYFPMECRHGILSMKHNVSGEMILNGEKLNFDNGTGYIETDSGHSFPEDYSWIQSNDFQENCSVMASVAKIPFAGLHFWGCICIVWLNGKQYRLATYKGAKIHRCGLGVMELEQGKYRFAATVNQGNALGLAAPVSGSMDRMIRESASCPAAFEFTENGKALFAGESKRASYEFMMANAINLY